MSLGSRLRELRKKKGWSQTELAQRAGMRQGHLSLIENDRRPNLAAVVAADLARALGVPMEYLLDLPGEPELGWMFDQIAAMSREERELVRFAIEIVVARRKRASPGEIEISPALIS